MQGPLILLPVALAVIMLGMGLALTPADFGRILSQPRAMLLGSGAQLVALPLMAFLTIYLLQPGPEVSIGLLILAFAPGGTISNLVTNLARGNVALSVSLTALGSVIAPFSVPLLIWCSARVLWGREVSFSMPVFDMIFLLMLTALLPVVLGMFVRFRFPEYALRFDGPVRKASVILLFLIIAGIMLKNREDLPHMIIETGAAVVLFNALAILIGYCVARAGRVDLPDRLTITIETGIQNGATAVFVANNLLQSPEMAVPAAVYGVWMLVPVFVFAIFPRAGRGHWNPAVD